MHILLITGSYPPMRCGVGDYSETLAHALTSYAGMQVDVLTSALEAPVSPAPGATVHYAMKSWDRGGVPDFIKVMRRTRPQLVHIQFPTQGYVRAVDALGWIALLCHFRFRVPVVQTWHEYVPAREPNILRSLYAMALGADALLVVRPDYARSVPRLMRLALGRAPIRYVAQVSNVPTVRLSEERRRALRLGLSPSGTARLVAHFGFAYPHKGTELLFQIADAERDHLVFIGELSPREPYHAQILKIAATPPWKGRVTVTGFVGSAQAAELLAAADAVVFPYLHGGGDWNSALHAAMSQGTFVIATSRTEEGYDTVRNVYHAKPGDLGAMRQALSIYGGRRLESFPDAETSWRALAAAHRAIYESLA